MFSAVTGGLAQLGEHLLCKQGVVGSIPSSSTITFWLPNASIDAVSMVFAFGLAKTSVKVRLFFNNMECSKGVAVR
jgi:hypothetical protein